jgi:F-type H+-transporting ATPase subunit alpha
MIKKKKKINAVVKSVVPFSDGQQTRLHQKLKEVLKSEDVSVQFGLDPTLLGGVTISINQKLMDLSFEGALQQFKNEMENQKNTDLNLQKLAEVFQKKIKDFRLKPTVVEVGEVISVSDGIAKVRGLDNLMSGECVWFESGAVGMAFNLNPETTDVVLFEKADTIREGDHTYATGQMNTIPVGLSLLGRILTPLGEPLDDKETLKHLPQAPVFVPVPGIVDRDKVQTPVQTGVKAIDALVPIGRGQRELIIGDRQTGKTTLILDTIINQRHLNEQATDLKEKVFCIYVAIGQKQSSVRDVMQTLQKYGAMDYTIIVSAGASDSAALQYLAPYAGCAIGEYFRDNGMNAIVFYDDLSKHAVAYREMSLLLKRPSGREAYPGDVFYLHSKLLERAAKMNADKGGGSLTAIPVIETQEGDVSAYVPTNVISITDGQIFLESSLFHQGVRPAVNVGLSVSRVGSAAQNSAIKKLSASLKLELSQYREVLNFAQLSSDLDENTQKLLSRGARLTEVMKQKPYHPLTVSQEIISLFAVVNGYLDEIPLEELSDFLSGLLAYFRLQGREILAELSQGEMTEEVYQKLDLFIRQYIENTERKKQVI